MKIGELIKRLSSLDQQAQVQIFAEGSECQPIRWISITSGTLLIGDTSEGSLPDEQVIYDNPPEPQGD